MKGKGPQETLAQALAVLRGARSLALSVGHLPSESNVLADSLSRLFAPGAEAKRWPFPQGSRVVRDTPLCPHAALGLAEVSRRPLVAQVGRRHAQGNSHAGGPTRAGMNPVRKPMSFPIRVSLTTSISAGVRPPVGRERVVEVSGSLGQVRHRPCRGERSQAILTFHIWQL